MKNILFQIASFSSKFDRRHVQLVLSLLALTLFVLGAGAPEDGGIFPK